MEIRVIDFNENGDDRGTLVALEEKRNVPFIIKRVYYMYNTVPTARRGYHAHRKLEQILICVSGSCKVLLDDGLEKETILLDQKNQGLYIGSKIWREMFDFTEDAVLMVLASELYDPADYIREYEEFVNYIKTDRT